MQKRAFVLLSGGVDSTTCLFKAIYDYAPQAISNNGWTLAIKDLVSGMIDGTRPAADNLKVDWVEAISVDYGQKHTKEMDYAKRTCDLLGIDHRVLNVRGILDGSGVMLTDANVRVPDISYADIKGVSPTYVPFRNGTLLSLITAHAQKYVNAEIEELVDYLSRSEFAENPTFEERQELHKRASQKAQNLCGVYFGAHAEDAFNWAYPDCTPEFIGAMANAIYIGSYKSIRLHTPIMWMSKAEVVKMGVDMDVPYENTWSCYKGEELHCGTCPTCRARKEAFFQAGVTDPTEYAQTGVIGG